MRDLGECIPFLMYEEAWSKTTSGDGVQVSGHDSGSDYSP